MQLKNQNSLALPLKKGSKNGNSGLQFKFGAQNLFLLQKVELTMYYHKNQLKNEKCLALPFKKGQRARLGP